MYFNDLTDSIFGQHRFEVEDMFYTIKEIQSEPNAQIAGDLGRDYEAVLDNISEVRDASGKIDGFEFFEVREADDIYVTGDEKRPEDKDSNLYERELKKRRGDFEDNKPSALSS